MTKQEAEKLIAIDKAATQAEVNVQAAQDASEKAENDLIAEMTKHEGDYLEVMREAYRVMRE
jgi:hypothetical protein